jgi:hypothetical protein
MEIIEIANTYLDALVSHEADQALLAADVRRINNGKLSVEGADALRAIIRREPVAAMSEFRWLVDGDQAIAFYDLEADLARASRRQGHDHADRRALPGRRPPTRRDRSRVRAAGKLSGARARPGALRPSLRTRRRASVDVLVDARRPATSPR